MNTVWEIYPGPEPLLLFSETFLNPGGGTPLPLWQVTDPWADPNPTCGNKVSLLQIQNWDSQTASVVSIYVELQHMQNTKITYYHPEREAQKQLSLCGDE